MSLLRQPRGPPAAGAGSAACGARGGDVATAAGRRLSRFRRSGAHDRESLVSTHATASVGADDNAELRLSDTHGGAAVQRTAPVDHRDAATAATIRGATWPGARRKWAAIEAEEKARSWASMFSGGRYTLG